MTTTTTTQTPEEVARDVYWTISDFPLDPNGDDLRSLMARAIEADRAQRDTDWTGTRPVLMRRGATVVTGSRMGPWGGVAVGSDGIRMMALPSEVRGYYNDYRVPYYAELPDSEWVKLGWSITEVRG